jgi:hypothetical protein
MSATIVQAPAHLFAPTATVRWRQEPDIGGIGNGSKKFAGQNPPDGAAVYYSLTQKADKASLKVLDYAGKLVRELPVQTEPGLHRAQWNLTRPAARTFIAAVTGQIDPEQAFRGRGGLFGTPVNPGNYRVVLTVDGKEYAQGLRVEADPTLNGTAVAAGDGDGDGSEDPDRDPDKDGPVDK